MMFLIVFYFLYIQISVPSENATSIIQKVIDSNRVNSGTVEILMELVDNKGRIRNRKLEVNFKMNDGLISSLVFFIEPKEIRGTGFLSLQREGGDIDRWIFLPALGREKRISGRGEGQSFMGSEFTFADLDPFNLRDAEYLLGEEEELNDRPFYVIEIWPDERSIYQKQKVWIDKERWVISKVIYFNRNGSELKQLTVEYESINNIIWLPSKMKMRNFLNGNETRLIYQNRQINPDFPGNYFSIKYLRQGLKR